MQRWTPAARLLEGAAVEGVRYADGVEVRGVEAVVEDDVEVVVARGRERRRVRAELQRVEPRRDGRRRRGAAGFRPASSSTTKSS